HARPPHLKTRFPLAIATLPCLVGGCVTPLATAGDRAYLGLYAVERVGLAPSVEYDRVVGVGFSIGRSGVGVGFSDVRAVVAAMSPEGCDVATPFGRLVMGSTAERAVPEFCKGLLAGGHAR